MLRLVNIKINVAKITNSRQEAVALRQEIMRKLSIKAEELLDYQICKKSVDARKKDEIYYTYTLDIQVINEQRLLNKNHRHITKTPDISYPKLASGTENMRNRPVIIGMGPAGLFAGLILARSGYRPIILERGEDVDTRTGKVNRFWHQGILDPESNVQFGEGGAGTFSDGKLNTLINDKRSRIILEEFIKAGAPEEILYLNKPHIGTDLLKIVVKKIREEIIHHGGAVCFKSQVTDFILKDQKIATVIINNSEKLACEVVLLGIGHSARDTFQILHQRGIQLSPKPFSIGVRIEHDQSFIDKAQYGSYASHPGLGAADYKLAYHGTKGRSAYTFCMCPGGYVVAAASEKGGVATNGMSEYRRNGKNANAAILVGVTPADYGSAHPLSGVEYQRKWERRAYEIGGNNYHAPVQSVGDFLADKPGTQLGTVLPTYRPGITRAELKYCLPDYVISTLKEALPYFDNIIKGYANTDALLTGVETRSSSPIRINRDENHQSNTGGLYPMGEGAGYAGGIMSSALDGLKTAEKIIGTFRKPK
jgi:uncharacterized FAD-dependent dehydrogenase